MIPICFLKTLMVFPLMLNASVAVTASLPAGKTPPVTLQFSLETPKTIVQGEPIIIKYTLANPTSQDVGVRRGQDESEWLTFSMTNAHGDTAKAVPMAPFSHSDSFGHPSSYFMDPHTSFDQEVIVTRYLTVSQPGNYTLTIHVHLPYVLAPASTIGRAGALIQSSGTVFTQDSSIPITVKPADSEALRASAETQTQSILHPIHPSDIGKRPMLIDALCTMPDAEAGLSWEALATGPDIMALREEVARSLSHAYSEKAADILAEINWETPIRQTDHDTEGAASDSLAKLYDSGSASLRAHIKTLFWQHGVQIGDTLPIATVVD